MRFKQRSYQKELIDGNPSFEDLKTNLDELHIINRYLGGYKISKDAIKKLDLDSVQLLDIGSGGGHMIKYLHQKFASNSSKNIFQGLDIKTECIQYAQEVCKSESILFYHADYKDAASFKDINVIHACLFFHHLNEYEISSFIKVCIKNSKTLIINDLERNPIAYYSIKILTRLFSKSQLVKNDAPLSVLRGFKRKEWVEILANAGAKEYSIKNKWAFRHQVIVYG